MKKANQKRHLDDMVIKGGGFTTDFFKNVDIRDLFDSTKDQLYASLLSLLSSLFLFLFPLPLHLPLSSQVDLLT